MQQSKINFYKLVLKIALTFRLSLKNVCILLGEEPTEEKQKEIYEIFDLLFGSDSKFRRYYMFLFEYETKLEPDFISESSLNAATLFYIKYRIATKNNDKENIKKLHQELDTIDRKVNSLKLRSKEHRLTNEEYETIIQYRIKYALSKEKICSYLDIDRDVLRVHENKLENSKLKYKIEQLNEYCVDYRKQKGM